MITTLHNQSFFDLAIQKYGTAEAAVQLAIKNELPMDYVPLDGESIKTVELTPNLIAEYYVSRRIIPATRLEVPQQLFENGLFDSELFE